MKISSNNATVRDIQHRLKVEQIHNKYPRLKQIEDEMYLILARLTRGLIGYPDQKSQEQLTVALEELRHQRSQFLEQHGLPENYNVPQSRCPICHDMEVIEGPEGWELCSCVRKRQQEYRFAGAKIPSKMREQTLENFSLSYYSMTEMVDERDSQHRKAEKALKGAEEFTESILQNRPTKGLYFFGGAGVGKTHLVSGIANRLMTSEITPLYLMVADLLDEIRKGYEASEVDTSAVALMEQAKETPVLILDDIGAERATEWSIEKLFQIINHRYLNQLPMVMTSNYDLDDLAYHMGTGATGTRICSRIIEMCRIFRLDADDIRRQKRRES
jgi:DNA replication protein DnaC